MNILIYGMVIFISAFLLQLVIWRIKLPKRQTIAILLIYMLTLILGLLFGIAKGLVIVELFHISIFVISLTFAYILIYPAIEVDSPSLVMIMAIADCGKAGLQIERFYQLLSDDLLVIPRLNDLYRDKLAYLDNDKYRLTKKGILFALIFINFRKLFKINLKGG